MRSRIEKEIHSIALFAGSALLFVDLRNDGTSIDGLGGHPKAAIRYHFKTGHSE
jgi:hypothetical protein